jgi:predicted aspartyl protease
MLVSGDYPYLQVRVTVRTRSFVYRALLDTGFDGYLVLPENLESQLGAPQFQVKTRLADGSESIRPHYHGGVEVVGLSVTFLAPLTLLGDECLIGQGIIRQLKVTFDHGKEVVIEP